MNRERERQKIRYLARRIGNRIAATIAEVKPATIVNLTNERGKVLTLWDECGSSLFKESHIAYYELRRKERNIIILFFSPCRLNKLLKRKEIKVFLSCFGYKVDQSLKCVLDLLKKRFSFSPFPHEIGIFLGIPLKDVQGFMQLITLPHTQTKRWKIFGEAEESLKIIEKQERAEAGIKRRISLGLDPLEIIAQKVKRREVVDRRMSLAGE